jgi:aspartyl-tRNA(Asn)/glutamyl-tRNA(Gln) amidotransferase subunit A
MQWTALTFPFNLTGHPAATVPAGWTDDGLPVGLQVVGRLRDDATVLRACAAYEQAAPWRHRRPDPDPAYVPTGDGVVRVASPSPF